MKLRRPATATVVDWGIPCVVAVLLLGPALQPGLLFNLDLVLTPQLDTPSGFWGLGPELPRRLPLWLPFSWLSSIVPGTLTGKLLMVALFVLPWVGMVRLTARMADRAVTGDVPRWVLHSAGAVYALSPFVLTRAAVGHFNVTWPLALLPWVLPALLRPGRRLSSTFLGAFALGFAGHFGGSVALVVVVVGVVADWTRGERAGWWKAIVVAFLAQAAWLVPGLVVSATNDVQMAGGAAFPTDAGSMRGLLRLSAGGGFWNTYYQVGGRGTLVALAGLILLAFAVVGTRAVARPLRGPLTALGVIGWFVAAASAIPGLDQVWVWVNDHLLAGVWREGHRVLTLHLVWLAPTAALGALRLYRASVARPSTVWFAGPAAIAPLAVAAALAVPGLWGIGGQLHADAEPTGWRAARALVDDHPGTVLALPWYQYFNLSVSDGPVRRVLNPMPLYLGGDVLASSDNGLVEGVKETGDPREPTANEIVDEVRAGRPVAERLTALGVRWVVLLKSVRLEDYVTLADDPGLRTAVDDDAIALYEVTGWKGAATGDDGPIGLTAWGQAVATVDGDGAFTWSRAGSGGWRRGLRSVPVASDGRLEVPAGSGPLWNVGTVPAVAAQWFTFGAAAELLRRRRSARRRELLLDDQGQ
ncbi:MAG: hypothetical protein ACOYMR_01025 [Ilumatobacteraceae bacterium]